MMPYPAIQARVRFVGLVLTLMATSLTAQNLVPNPSFEEFTTCPIGYNPGFGPLQCTPWVVPTNGSADYFHACHTGVVGVPNNAFAMLDAHTGDAYCGALFYYQDIPDYREYLQVQLTEPMVAGRIYSVCLYYVVGNLTCLINRLGIYFSDSAIQDPVEIGVLNVQPQLEAGPGLLDNSDWELFSGFYVAEGGEQWMTIGNFYDDLNISLGDSLGCPMWQGLRVSYMFIDDVVVQEGSTSGVLEFSLGSDTTACKSFVIHGPIDNAFYLWQDGSNSQDYIVTETGEYHVIISQGCSIGYDTIVVTILDDIDEVDLGPDVVICPPEVISITLDSTIGEIIWQDGSTSSSYTIAAAGAYSVTVSNGCGSTSDTLLVQVACDSCEQDVVCYDLNACLSYLDHATSMDYSEFVPAYPQGLPFATISAGILHRENPQENKHSCTPGVNDSPAMCVSALNSCTYAAGDDASIVFEVTIVPDLDSAVRVTRLSFFEKSPTTYDWIGGPSGPNNYPTKFGVRILKNGTEIFLNEDMPSAVDTWTEVELDFTGDDNFTVIDSATFRVELLPYCLIGNGATVAAWDVDEVRLSTSCEAVMGLTMDISGKVGNAGGSGLGDVMMQLSQTPKFIQSQVATTDVSGRFTYDRIRTADTLYLQAYKNTDLLFGVSTLDLVRIQKHLLSLDLLKSPYQMIAADINHSESVSVLDLIELRELLLGRITAFRDNTSWRFGPLDQGLTMENPWNFIEVMRIPNTGSDVDNADFIAVKIGDVTQDIWPIANQPQVRSNPYKEMQLTIADRFVNAGETVEIQVPCDDFDGLTGFQLALNVSDLHVLDVSGGHILLTEKNYFIDSAGVCRIIWYDGRGVTLPQNGVLFWIEAVALKSGYLSDLIEVANGLMDAEVYVGTTAEVVRLNIDFVSPDHPEKSNVSFDIYPNPMSARSMLKFELAHQQSVRFEFFDLTGVLIYRLENQFDHGTHEVALDPDEFSSQHSVIICQMVADEGAFVKKICVVPH